MTTIGFIGLGHMGHPMVDNLLKNKYTVKVFDLVETAVKQSVKSGAAAGKSPGNVAMDADVVITMLQTSDQVKECCLGKSGIFENLNKKGALYIDCSSIDVVGSRELHQEAKSRGIAMLDAPVSGGVAAAEKATLTFMVGGEASAFECGKPILSAMGKKIIHAGSAGTGAAAKICNNMILGISMIAVSEAFVLADKLGLSAEKLFEITSNASGQCWSLTSYCPWPGILPNVPSSNNYQPGFTSHMMLKDLKLSQEAAQHANAYTPLGQHAMKIYQDFVDTNHASVDFSGIIQMLKEKS